MSSWPVHSSLRGARLLARAVLAWFVLSIGVAVASPLVHPLALELVCTGGGAIKLVATGEGGAAPTAIGHADCPLCNTHGAPPPALRMDLRLQPPAAGASIAASFGHGASLDALPPPARAPPVAIT
ncbi:MAG: DUF2946 domain-containing protein [Burkholderiaceae bacterium]|nr:DUF2946 domain-containing protein [Burkholderiaceae bacterium]